MKGILLSFLLFGTASIFSLGVSEVVTRQFLSESLETTNDERSSLYQHHPRYGWFPKKNTRNIFTGSREISVRHNSSGFRGAEFPALTDSAKRRIAVYGDSFVWGYDVEENERFTELLAEKLDDSSIFNFGISGFGTDQELLLLRDTIDTYKPDAVLLVFCADNDRADNSSNIRYGGYYKPFFSKENGKLKAHNVPVPKSRNYYVPQVKEATGSIFLTKISDVVLSKFRPAEKNLNEDPSHFLIEAFAKRVEKSGAKFHLILTSEDTAAQSFADSIGISWTLIEGAEKFSVSGNHWTPTGHQKVQEVVQEKLERLLTE